MYRIIKGASLKRFNRKLIPLILIQKVEVKLVFRRALLTDSVRISQSNIIFIILFSHLFSPLDFIPFESISLCKGLHNKTISVPVVSSLLTIPSICSKTDDSVGMWIHSSNSSNGVSTFPENKTINAFSAPSNWNWTIRGISSKDGWDMAIAMQDVYDFERI